jgi:16S rRNA (uracil1498-N3)-methyltransferase
MTRRRFYAPPEAFDLRTGQVTLALDEARHLREVLRLKPGDQVRVFDGGGNEYSATIEKALRDSAMLALGEKVVPQSAESPLKLTLAVAMLKGDKFDLVVQKATELGVSEIIPVMTKFADIRLHNASDASKRVSRWQRISLEASKQSGRAVLPIIQAPLEFDSVVTGGSDDATLRVMFGERDGESMAALPETVPSQTITTLIGSEGGWAVEEIESARKHRWKVVTLGGRILRAETAAIAATTLIQHRYGDLR